MKKGKYVYEWPRPMVTVDALIFAKFASSIRVLLIKRGNDPFKGLWAVPGGFVDMDEDLLDAAKRELMEETSLTNIDLEQFHTFGKPGRDPRGRNVTIVFWSIQPDGRKLKPKAGDDAAQAKWFNINNLPPLAFDHEEVLKLATAKLKRKRATWFS